MKRPLPFGKYLLLERLNVGGMAEVFLAKQFGVAGFERILAIKKILPTMAEDEEFITMFIDEARISVQLNHANVVQIHELGRYEQNYYIAMEYVAGRDLRTILEWYRRQKVLMPTAQAVFVASRICEGLDYAHRKKDARGQDLRIIHRDVSPQNILVSYEGEVKIIDFGIAKAENRSQKTQAGILKGKFGYMSPEQVRGLPIDRRSDIFAVGVILYELLTGEKLFVGESDFSVLEKVRNADVPPPRQFNPDVPPALERVVLQALAREQDERYQWASELQEDLMRFLLAKDAIYSAKHLGTFMKEAFAEDLLREAERMERFASVDRPEQVETSAVVAQPPGRPRKGSVDTALPSPERATVGARLPDFTPAAVKGETDPSLAPLPSGRSPLDDEDPFDRTLVIPEVSRQSAVSDASMGTSSDSVPWESPTRRPPQGQVIIGDAQAAYGGVTVIGPTPVVSPVVAEPPPRLTQLEVPEETRARAPEPEAPSQDTEDELEDEEGSDSEGTLESPSEGRLDRGDVRPLVPGSHTQLPVGEEEITGPAGHVGRMAPARIVHGTSSFRISALLDQPRLLWGWGAAAASILLLVATFWGMAQHRHPELLLDVAPRGLTRLFLDGTAVPNLTTVTLAPGVHTVRAEAPGHHAQERRLEVHAGDSRQVVAWVLLPDDTPQDAAVTSGKSADSKPAAPTQAAAPSTAAAASPAEKAVGPRVPGLAVQTRDVGATRQGERPSGSPAEILPPTSTVEPTGSEVSERQSGSGARATTSLATFKVRFLAEQAGVEFRVGERAPVRSPGAVVEGLEVGKAHRYTARLDGFDPIEGVIRSDGRAEIRVRVDLARNKDAAPVPRSTPAVPTSKAAKGKLACSSIPAGAQIWIDGKYSGRDTPVPSHLPLFLPVGKYEVVLMTADKSKKSAPQAVEIAEDETLVLKGIRLE